MDSNDCNSDDVGKKSPTVPESRPRCTVMSRQKIVAQHLRVFGSPKVLGCMKHFLGARFGLGDLGVTCRCESLKLVEL